MTTKSKRDHLTTLRWATHTYQADIWAECSQHAIEMAIARCARMFPNLRQPDHAQPEPLPFDPLRQRRGARFERNIIDAEFPEVEPAAAPPPVNPCAVTNEAVRASVHRREQIDRETKDTADEDGRLGVKLRPLRSGQSELAETLAGLGADPAEGCACADCEEMPY